MALVEMETGLEKGLTSLDTEALVGRCQGGDHLAIEVLVHRYQNYVYRLCFLVMRNEQDAEDMTQETFIRAFRALPRFEMRQDTSFDAWLYRIAVNACRSRMRRKWFQVLPWPEPAPQLCGEPEEQPERQVLRFEQREEMLTAIDALGEKHRLVVVLRYYAGLSNEEIAEALNIPSGTVRSRLHMARQRLKELLSDHQEEKSRSGSQEVAA